jgi:hypothetical protein
MRCYLTVFLDFLERRDFGSGFGRDSGEVSCLSSLLALWLSDDDDSMVLDTILSSWKSEPIGALLAAILKGNRSAALVNGVLSAAITRIIHTLVSPRQKFDAVFPAQ